MLPIRAIAAIVVLAFGVVLAAVYFLVSWVIFGISMLFYYLGRFFDLRVWKGNLAILAWGCIFAGMFAKSLHQYVKEMLAWHATSTKSATHYIMGPSYRNESRKV